MKVTLFGATGMVGQGVLRECLGDEGVESVLAIGRTSIGRSHSKLRELLRKDLFDFGGVNSELQGHVACFFCLGVSSAGMPEDEYTRSRIRNAAVCGAISIALDVINFVIFFVWPICGQNSQHATYNGP
jgi:putative NADH-flavin reductase